MPSIRLNTTGAVLTTTDDAAAARKDLSLVTLDRAHGLVTGGKATWVDPPAAPEPAAVKDPAIAAAAPAIDAAKQAFIADPMLVQKAMHTRHADELQDHHDAAAPAQPAPASTH